MNASYAYSVCPWFRREPVLTRVVLHHVLVVPVRGRGQVHGGPERGEQSYVGRVQLGGGRAEFTDNGIAAEHHSGT